MGEPESPQESPEVLPVEAQLANLHDDLRHTEKLILLSVACSLVTAMAVLLYAKGARTP